MDEWRIVKGDFHGKALLLDIQEKVIVGESKSVLCLWLANFIKEKQRAFLG